MAAQSSLLASMPRGRVSQSQEDAPVRNLAIRGSQLDPISAPCTAPLNLPSPEAADLVQRALHGPQPGSSVSQGLPPGCYHLPCGSAQIRLEAGNAALIFPPDAVIQLEPRGPGLFEKNVFVGKRGTPRRRALRLTLDATRPGSVQIRGPYADHRFGTSQTIGPEQEVVFAPVTRRTSHHRYFNVWVAAQVAGNPEIGATFKAIGERLCKNPEKGTLGDLVAFALERAAEAVPSIPGANSEYRRQRIVLTALSGLAGHALRAPGSEHRKMPHFLPGSRGGNIGMDSGWHVCAQGLYAAVQLFDRRYGCGAVAAAFTTATESLDADGMARFVDEAYERVRAAPGPLIPNALAGPEPLTPEPYFPRPTDLNEEEALAYDLAVRTGSAYEHHSTPERWRNYDPAALGTHPELTDPTAEVDDPADCFSGLSDPNVCRDLTANRIGAYLAIQLMRGLRPDIPWDQGQSFDTRPFAERERVCFADLYADESVMLARLGGLQQTVGIQDREAHRKWAVAQGSERAMQELKHKLREQAQQLGVTEKETLARYYGNFAVRARRHRVPLGGGNVELPNFRAHYRAAMRRSCDWIVKEIENRLDHLAKRFG